jgi:uncharacterized protein (TIGR03083 family)
VTHDWDLLLASATSAFADVLEDSDPTDAVPSCPGWTVADLVDHLGGVHQWAWHAVVFGNPDGKPEPAPTDPAELVSWYAGHAGSLRDALAAAGAEGKAWTFGTESTAGWWLRRQTHETRMHTRDLLEAGGWVDEWELAPELAWDGVQEVATEFYPRQVRLERTEPIPGTLHLVASDLPGAAPVVIGEAEPVVEVSAPAVDVLLMLWHRQECADPAAAALLALPIAP